MTVTINGTTGLATDSTSAVVEAVSLNHPSSSTAAITMDASNNVTLASNLTMTGGIYLGGSGSANLLQDYEEGSFTPTLSFSSGTIGYAWNTGQYTKVGNQVSANIAFYVNSISSPSGTMGILGLPFVAASGEQYVSALNFGIIRSLTSDLKPVRGYINSNSSLITLTINATNGGFTALNANTLTTSTLIYASIVYQTS